MAKASEAQLETVAKWLRSAKCAVAFTGAGMSTKSGIPDFRSPEGIWAKAQPVFYRDFLSSTFARHEYWRQKAMVQDKIQASEPNDGHKVLAQWEQAKRLTAVITQNIDGLHQRAGSQKVLELHGNALYVRCLDCEGRFPAAPLVEEFQEKNRVPPCKVCGGRLKHATVSFGQSLPTDLLDESERLCREADLFLALGSSLIVEPAASLPRLARHYGSRLVIINLEPTPQDPIADLVIQAELGETLTAIEQLRAKA